MYKTVGLIYEYIGNLKTAVRFYLIFLHVKTVDLELSSRYVILIFWQDAKYFLNSMLLKSLIKYNLFLFKYQSLINRNKVKNENL